MCHVPCANMHKQEQVDLEQKSGNVLLLLFFIKITHMRAHILTHSKRERIMYSILNELIIFNMKTTTGHKVLRK